MEVWGTIHAFALPDKNTVLSTLHHMRAAGFTAVVLPVPWRVYQPQPDVTPDFELLCLWLSGAHQCGMRALLAVGPVLEVGVSAWGLPQFFFPLSPQARVQALENWWRVLRDVLPLDGVLVHAGPHFTPAEQERLRRFWGDVPTWREQEFQTLDLRRLDWQEWEEDTAWWEEVDSLAPDRPVRVRAWWVGPGRGHVFPAPEVVHETLGEPFVRVLLASLWARGVQHLWWDPLRGGVAWGTFPPRGWETSHDGGAPFRTWGEPTATWWALKRSLLQAQSLAPAQASWQADQGEGTQNCAAHLAVGEHSMGRLLLLRRLSAGVAEVPLEVSWKGRRISSRPVALTGPDARLFPLMWSLAEGQGTLLFATGEVMWRQVAGRRDLWMMDITRGADLAVHLGGTLVYETGVDVVREGEMWRVVFTPNQQGQIIWRVGDWHVQVVGVGAEMAGRLWPGGLWDGQPLVLGPDQVWEAVQAEGDVVLRVSTERPTAFMVLDARPWDLRVVETGKRSVWGARAGMGGVSLGGPKEWGAPRVALPELTWEVQALDGPARLASWQSLETVSGREWAPGWHWFQVEVPPEWESVTLAVRGVCDVWLGEERVGGMGALERSTWREVRLPPRLNTVPLTILLWVPQWPVDDALTPPGEVDIALPGASLSGWRYRPGLRWITQTLGGEVRWDEGDERMEQEGGGYEASVWAYRAQVPLDIPAAAWVSLGVTLVEMGGLAWVFLNGVLVGQWWEGRTREPVLWLPPALLDHRGENQLIVVHWPRGRPLEEAQIGLVQLCRQRVSTVTMHCPWWA